MEQHLRLRPSARLRRCDGARDVHDHDERRSSRNLSRVQDRHGRERLRDCARERPVLLPDGARRPELHPERVALRACTSQRPERDDLRHAARELRRPFLRRPASARRSHRRVRRLVGRRGLHQGSRDTRLHDRIAAARRARVPDRDGRRVQRTEAKFGTDWLLRMWDDPTRTFYYQVGIGSGNAKTVGDHDLWRLPQADDTFGGTDPLYRYIRNRPVFRHGAPGSPISPNLAGRDAAVFGLCYQIFKTSDPAFANRCLLAGVHIFDLANTNPRPADDVHPVQLLSGDRVAQRPRARRCGALPRHRERRARRPGCRTMLRTTSSRRRTGRTRT